MDNGIASIGGLAPPNVTQVGTVDRLVDIVEGAEACRVVTASDGFLQDM
jgi:hypothetical protein